MTLKRYVLPFLSNPLRWDTFLIFSMDRRYISVECTCCPDQLNSHIYYLLYHYIYLQLHKGSAGVCLYYGCMGIRVYICMGVRVYGCTGVQVYGCMGVTETVQMGVWIKGCTGVRVSTVI
jgi:hypothetical protein